MMSCKKSVPHDSILGRLLFLLYILCFNGQLTFWGIHVVAYAKWYNKHGECSYTYTFNTYNKEVSRYYWESRDYFFCYCPMSSPAVILVLRTMRLVLLFNTCYGAVQDARCFCEVLKHIFLWNLLLNYKH